MVIKKTIRVPEKLYIQTLIVGGFNAEKVIDELTRLRIDIPLADIENIIAEIKVVVPDLFTSGKALEDHEIETLNLFPMYYYRFQKTAPPSVDIAGCQNSLEMLEDPTLRKNITALSLAGVNPLDIELLINARYHVTWESQDFQNFIKFFANFDEWSYADREFFVENRIKDAEYKLTLKKAALKGDRHYLVWKLGLGTDPHMSMEAVFTDMIADSYFTFKENIKARPDDAQKFAQLAIRLSDRLDKNESSKKESTSLLEELKIKLTVETTKPGSSENQVTEMSEIGLELPKRETVKSVIETAAAEV
jgi:hypothetical protein